MVHRIKASARSGASPGRVFALLTDGSTWPQWGRWDRFELARPDPSGGEGVGAERVFHSRVWGRPVASRERVTVLQPDRHLEYALVSGLPLRDYVGSVTLTPDGTGTQIIWSSSFRRAVPGLSRLYRLALDRFITDAVHRLAAHAERPAGRP